MTKQQDCAELLRIVDRIAESVAAAPLVGVSMPWMLDLLPLKERANELATALGFQTSDGGGPMFGAWGNKAIAWYSPNGEKKWTMMLRFSRPGGGTHDAVFMRSMLLTSLREWRQEIEGLATRTRTPADDADFVPIRTLPKALHDRVRQAATPQRKTLRVRKTETSGQTMYSRTDARKHWPELFD